MRSMAMREQIKWAERQERSVGRPLLTLLGIAAFALSALQVWIASHFTTKAELQMSIGGMQESFQRAHAEHMADYEKLNHSIENINRLLMDRLPRPRER